MSKVGAKVQVERLALENWRGFERLELEFHPRLTLLVGENGSGKSAVLEALAHALDICVNVAQTSGFRIPGDAVRIGADRASVELVLREGDRARSQRFVVGPAGVTVSPSWQVNATPGAWPMVVMYGTERTVRDLTPQDHAGARDFEPWAEARLALDPKGVGFDRFFEWFQARENIENEHRIDAPEHRDAQLEAVRAAITRLTGFSAVRVRREPRNRLTVVKLSEQVLFDQLSSGERALVALVADVARRLAISTGGEAPLSGGGVVLVDEVDLHLHPRWQSEVLTRLMTTFPNVQWVTTTHSPIVAMHVDRASVRVLKDFRLVEAPFTRGRDANSLYADLFEVNERPRETLDRLEQLGRRLDAGDIVGARKLIDDLATDLGENDPTVVEQRLYVGASGE
ncbi:MAG: AAA family ATPase [Myxococcota bacterium]